MMRYIKTLFLFSLLAAVNACKEDHLLPLENDATPPGQILHPVVQPTPGGAKITYALPNSANLLYVMAEVKNKRGQLRDFKASYYTNSLEIDGLSDTDPYEVKLYSVNKSEKRSEPVVVTIHPLEPPFSKVFKSFEIRSDFGGVNLKFENPDLADLVIGLCGDSLGVPLLIDNYYTNLKSGSYTFRGLAAEKRRFGVFIKDKFGNTSDTTFAELTPLYEKMLDKSKFREVRFPGDAPINTSQWNIALRNIWDGKWSSDFNYPYDGNGNNWLNVSTDGAFDGTPMHITMDLGVAVHISRFRLNNYYKYINVAMRKYEIWGAVNPPADGSWNGWTKILTYEQIKPSGLPGEQYNDADAAAWLKGDQANFPPGMPEFRYIRIRCLENWKGDGNLCFSEITFWGDAQ